MWCAGYGIAGTTTPWCGSSDTGRYIDPAKVKPLDHVGRFFTVQGPAANQPHAAGPADHPAGRLLRGPARSSPRAPPTSSSPSCRT